MAEQMQLVDENGHGKMTKELRRLFISEGCDPQCHACKKDLRTNARFALVEGAKRPGLDGYDTTVEVMVCWACKDRDLPQEEKDRAAEAARLREARIAAGYGIRSGGCFVVNGKIVPSGAVP